jgi:hypothetical protein
MAFLGGGDLRQQPISPLALGVPPMLLGIPGDNTYSNFQEATRTFWRQTVLPLVERVAKALSLWLGPAYGSALALKPDLDSIEALAPEREALWARLEKTSFLTLNEKRTQAGFGPAAGGDQVKQTTESLADKFNPHHDDRGRFTFAPDGGGGGQQVAQGGRRRPPPTNAPASKPGTNPPLQPGTTLRNKELAGKKHPDTGIPFDKDGFPDFSGVAQRSVRVPHTGNRDLDTAAANRAAGLTGTPPGMTWHHHQDGFTMQLVPFDVHRRTGHTGSIGIGNTPGKK